MLEHHRKAIENLIEYFKPNKEVYAVVLGGSVAKGLARPDSDIDALIIVSNEEHARHEKKEHFRNVFRRIAVMRADILI